jgi:hypothetical protein
VQVCCSSDLNLFALGNRQEDYVSEHRPLYVAPHWRNGAIGNARWAGVKVRDLLEAAGMPVDDIALRRATPGGKIVNFIAMDTDETGTVNALSSSHK